MPKAVKKSGKKKPSRQEAGEMASAGNDIPVPVTETREDGAETAVLTDVETQAGGSHYWWWRRFWGKVCFRHRYFGRKGETETGVLEASWMMKRM